MKTNKTTKILTGNSGTMVIFLCILCFVINCIFVKGFTKSYVLIGMINLLMPLACITIGQAIVVIGGGIDVSLGANVCFVNVTFVACINRGMSFGTAVVIALLASCVVGALNGFVVGYLRISPLLATFATQSVAQGLALTVFPLPKSISDVSFVKWYGSGRLFGILPNSLIFLIIPLVFWYILKRTRFGLHMYGMGCNAFKAYASGIKVHIVQFMTFIIAALMAGLAGIAYTGNIGSGDPTSAMTLTMNSVAAVVIGGISLSGGTGDVLGAVFGALFLNMITYTVSGMHVSVFYQDLIKALIILAGVLGMTLIRNRSHEEVLSK